MSAAAMAISSPDILESLFRVNWTYADHARASTVSRSWHTAARKNRPSAPMLMLPPAAEVFMTEYAKISNVCWLWRPTGEPPLTPPSATSPTFLHVFGGRGAEYLHDDDNYSPVARASAAHFLGDGSLSSSTSGVGTASSTSSQASASASPI
ncbi:hypothetical protein PR202_gb28263 [Eleusine coracana subsp. coracana]|uniref:Uncharacterized protein n=1 Tax=Eleusine coracana subsp. coracana TaxID=191504 RepID=A0AAV5FX14_ELECO|nr:hypothetical protein PR202_gb28263 [Eleusine coracana subsp. coracana]